MTIPYINNYGYGWVIESRYGYSHYFHSGLIDGFNTYMDRWPELGLCVIVFSNDDMAPVKKIARGLTAICLSQECQFPIKKSPTGLDLKIYQEYIGVFKNDFNDYQIINFDNNYLFIRNPNQSGIRVFPEGFDSLYYESDNTKTIIFQRNEINEVISMEIKDDCLNLLYNKLNDSIANEILINREEVTINQSLLRRYEGKYHLETVSNSFSNDFVLEITCDSNKVLAQISAGDVVELYPNSQNTFFHKENDILLTFIRDEWGKATGCIITFGVSETYGKKIID